MWKLLQSLPLGLSILQATGTLGIGVTEHGELGIDALPIVTPAIESGRGPIHGVPYSLIVETRDIYCLDLRSHDFDSHLILRDSSGQTLAENGDGPVGRHARVTTELHPGRYTVLACALDGRSGPFELIASRGEPAALSGPERISAEILDATERLSTVRASSDNTETVKALRNLGFWFREAGRYEEAIAPEEEAVALLEDDKSSDPSLLADTLTSLSKSLSHAGRFEEAFSVSERNLKLCTINLGPRDPKTGSILTQLSALHRNQGRYAEARKLAEQALEIHEETLGPEAPETANTLHYLGSIHWFLKEYEEALTYHQRALEIREHVLGSEDTGTTISLNDLALTLASLGRYEEALVYYERALHIREQTLGVDHPYTGIIVGNLANLLHRMGDSAEAARMAQRRLAQCRTTFGDAHPSTARAAQNLAVIVSRLSEDHTAGRLHAQAIEVFQQALGQDHPDTLKAVTSLGRLEQRLRNYKASRQLFERAFEFTETRSGPEHPDTVKRLLDLASLSADEGDHDLALGLYEDALSRLSWSSTTPPSSLMARIHWLEAESLRNLERFQDAEISYERAISISPTSGRLADLARASYRQGHYEDALEHLNRAQREYETERATPTSIFRWLAYLLLGLGRTQEAAEALLDEPSDASEFIHWFASMTEGRRLPFVVSRGWLLEVLLSGASHSGSSELNARAYDAVLSWKGQLLRLSESSQERLRAGLSREQSILLQGLHAVQRRLSQLSMGIMDYEPEALRRALRDSREERHRIETELARSLGENPSHDTVTFADLNGGLPPDSAFVDFFIHRDVEPGLFVEGTPPRRFWTATKLSAWITRKGQPDPIRIELGDVAAIQEDTRRHLETLSASRGVPLETGQDSPSRKLRGVLWDPLLPYLEGAETIFLSPDGFLGTLPFETLKTDDGHFLIEDRAFVRVLDNRLLLRKQQAASMGRLLAIGGVDFQHRDEAIAAESLAATSSTRRGFSSFWHRLPGTTLESQLVHDVHEAHVAEAGERLLLQGASATEERIRTELPAFQVVHLATHGFFNPLGLPSLQELARRESADHPRDLRSANSSMTKELPGLLSGLVCAGANSVDEGRDDGYLTAEEVSWLDLSEVQLVVLSACETGLGREYSGEGLVGLQRAFHAAGARSVVSSLWSINDTATSELMRDFYLNLFKRGMGPVDALRGAQLDMLRANREELGAALPASWGAFVISGSWR